MVKVSEYIVSRLAQKGVRHAFMVTGGGAMHLNDAFARSESFEVIYQHHEQACAIAAEGLFRASGQIGAINVTTGPGGLNALVGAMGQWTDSVPAIYVSGQVKRSTTLAACPSLPLRQLGDQEVDIIAIVRPLMKYARSVSDVREVPQAVEEALSAATTGRKGPVWLDIPMDIQGAELAPSDLPLSPVSEPSFKPASASCDPVTLRKVLALLSASERPVIVAGHGVRLANSAVALEALLAHLRIPALTTFNGYDLLPSDHPSYAGRIGTLGTRGGNFTLQNADFVLFLGTRNNIRQVSYAWENFAHRATTVAVDIDEAELTKPTFSPAHGIVADLAEFLPRLLEEALKEKPRDRSSWLTWAKARTARYPGVLEEQRSAVEAMHPYAFLERLTQSLPEGATVVAGNGTACVGLFQAGVVKKYQRVFWNSGCASMGYDLPAAIGAAVGTKGPVWCVAGDGSLQMNLQELSTMSHLQLPIKLVYLDNGGYVSIRQTQKNFFGAEYGCGPTSGLGFPDVEKLSAAFGLPYLSSERLVDVDEHQREVARISGPVFWHVKLRSTYAFEPKVSSEKLADGRIVSKPLEDMAPFLSREEFAENMWRGRS